jgi:hypothetical protein
MSMLGDFPTPSELDDMSKDELEQLWRELLHACSFEEGAIACRAFDIGWRSAKAVDA